MPERRFQYVQRIAEKGLSAPDETTLRLLWQIVDEGMLGASHHVRLTQELLVHLLESVPDPDEAWVRAETVARFIAETRGEQAPVVANVAGLLLNGLGDRPAQQRMAALRQRIEDWRTRAEQNRLRLVAAAVAALARNSTIVAYDYSSTVADVVQAVCHERPESKIVVPESRAIAGGRRYLEAFTRMGIAVHYILDAAFEDALGPGAAVLLGAECIRCDGSLVNTIGSKPLARLARWCHCPVYACTDLLKLDLRSYQGFFAQPARRRFEHLLDGVDLPAGAEVITEGVELEAVPAELITGFLTEHGPVPPAAIWSLGRQVYAPCWEAQGDE